MVYLNIQYPKFGYCDKLKLVAAKQNKKFSFHFLSAPPHPRRKNKKGKENFWFLPATSARISSRLSDSEVSICGVYCTKFEPILKAIPTNRTRGARGGSKLNRTLQYAPHAGEYASNPERKTLLAFLVWRG